MKKKMLALLLAVAMLLGCMPKAVVPTVEEVQAATETEAEYPYLDTTLSFEERAADLVSRMTLEEKELQLITSNAAAIPRLGVAEYNYWSEGLHGVARSGAATSYPHGLGIASTWNEEMVNLMGVYIADEARGYSNGQGKGLSYWNPTINLARDPRWGRAEEGYGEDPYLTATLAENVVNGMQGDDERYLQTIATLKHFVANNSEYNRHTGSSDMDERDLREYYSYTFKNVVENTEVASVMSSYNRVNGVPMSANEFMLTDVLRNTWGFNGYVTSDCWAIADIYGGHQWQPEGYDHVVNATEATALSIAAGCDINCGSTFHVNTVSAVEQGLLSEDDVDQALIRLFAARMQTGEFDPAEMVPYRSEEYSFENQVEAESHKQLAEDMADESIILLKNENNALPLDGTKKNIVVVGELAQRCIQGDYSADPSDENRSTPIEGITAAAARAGEDVEVTYINHYGNKDVASYLLNIQGIELNYSASSTTLLANQADSYKACIVESNTNQNFGYINSGAYAVYESVDITDLQSFGVQAAGASADAYASTVELHLDDPDGPVIATVNPDYTSAWQTYATKTSDVVTDATGVHDLYVTFTYRLDDIAFSAEEEATIAAADAVIVVAGTRTIDGEGALGNTAADSAEERDRETLDFPRNQAGSILEVAGLNENTIVCIQAVGQMNVEPFKDEVKAITWSTYNGQAQGNAIGRILYGEKNPSARLTFSWYTSLYELDAIGDYNLRGQNDTNGRTYQYFDGSITYPFGYGLSYTDFAYSNMIIDKTSATTDDQIQVSVDVTNTGSAAGQEVVQMYVVSPNAEENDRPVKRLQGFDKVELAAGETKTVTLTLETSGLEYWYEESDKFDYDLGTYEIQISTSAADADIMATKTFSMTEKAAPTLKTVTLTGKQSFDGLEIAVQVETELTAAMSDDSFCELSADMVTYSSSNEAVAKVDENGQVTVIGFGTALITAKVTVDGVTVSDSYAVAAVDDVNNLYYIASKADENLVVAVDGGATTAGTQLIEWENNGGTDQQWYMEEATEEGCYYFVDNRSSHYMSVQDTTAETIIVQAEANEADTKQMWKLEESETAGYYYLVNVASGYVLTRGPEVANAVVIAPLIQAEKGAVYADNQLWTLQALGAKYVIDVKAGEGGSIAPEGITSVSAGSNRVYRITPDEGYRIKSVLVNGESVGAVTSYTLTNIQEDTTIEAVFEVKQDVGELPEVLADFSFDAEPAEGEAFDGGYAQATGTYTLAEHEDGMALSLDGSSQFLNVTAKDESALLTGLDEFTVSFQMKPETSATNWTFFAAPDGNAQVYLSEQYLGIFDNNGTVTAERYNSSNIERPANPGYAAGYDDWYDVTVVYTAFETILYVNGEEVGRESSIVDISDMLGDYSVLYIGKATWGSGEYYKGLIDNYKIYSRALTADEVVNGIEEPKLPFTDVAETDWFYDAVYYNYFEGLMAGMSETTFAPLDTLSRAQLAIILYRMEGSPEVTYSPVFFDVADGTWFTSAVLWAQENGIVTGYGNTGTFGPHDNITREQMAVMMYRYAAYKGYDTSASADISVFTDAASVSTYADAAMKWAVGEGVITGKAGGTALDPSGNTLRAECAVIIHRFMENYNK